MHVDRPRPNPPFVDKSGDKSLDKSLFEFFNLFCAMKSCTMNARSTVWHNTKTSQEYCHMTSYDIYKYLLLVTVGAMSGSLWVVSICKLT